MTEEVGPTKLLAALAEFQKKAVTVGKTAENPFFHSAYAPLPEILKTIQPVLDEVGLVIAQFPCTTNTGGPGLVTIIGHPASGETMSWATPLVLKEDNPQAQGSAITYMRRYALAAALQIIIDEDDDGNKASGDPGFHTAFVENASPASQIKQTYLSGAIQPDSSNSNNIDPETFKELNFLPGKLKLPKDKAKQVWDRAYQQGWRRGKFDFENTKTWSGTDIPANAVGTIVSWFAEAAGQSPEQTKILVQQFVGDEPVQESLEDYSDEPF